MISYANQEFSYEFDHATEELLDADKAGRKKDYSRGRANKPTRRRARRKTPQPGCGIAGRRNRRFNW